ncbi:MAG: hypothetical protein NVS3B20_15720 [Polyangiales bacterium]
MKSRPLLTAEEIWRRYDAVESRLTAEVSERMLDLARLRPGMHVLDLATGRGEPALRAARRVGPTGTVLGVDLSHPLLEMARGKAAAEGLSNIEFRVANAESVGSLPRGYFHAATIRWGLMYMDNSIAALANTRTALLEGGALIAALWAEPERVPYCTLPRVLLQRYRPVPAFDPEAPGTFRYADLPRIERDLSLAGYQLDHVEEIEVPVFEAATGAELVEWARALGLTQLLNDLPEEDQKCVGRGLDPRDGTESHERRNAPGRSDSCGARGAS